MYVVLLTVNMWGLLVWMYLDFTAAQALTNAAVIQCLLAFWVTFNKSYLAVMVLLVMCVAAAGRFDVSWFLKWQDCLSGVLFVVVSFAPCVHARRFFSPSPGSD